MFPNISNKVLSYFCELGCALYSIKIDDLKPNHFYKPCKENSAQSKITMKNSGCDMSFTHEKLYQMLQMPVHSLGHMSVTEGEY